MFDLKQLWDENKTSWKFVLICEEILKAAELVAHVS